MSGACVMKPATVDGLLESLCNMCDDELERQETALALCRAQGGALRAQDTACMETKTKALELIIREAIEAEVRRRQLLQEVAERYGLSSECTTLSALIRAVSEPWRRRLAEFQTRMRLLLQEMRATVRANAGLLRASMKVVDEAMGVWEEAAGAAAGGYTAQGEDRAGKQLQPALIDQRG